MGEGRHDDLVDALGYIDPAGLDYQSWLEVGMALHDSGLPMEAWDAWSRRDPARYHDGECARKWEGFGHGDGRVTSGTIAKMARDRGWDPRPVQQGPGEALEWDGEVAIVDPTWLEPSELPGADGADPAKELAAYISALFDGVEAVAYVCASFERDGRRIPANKGVFTRTANDILRDLDRYGDIDTALGAYDHDAGAWIRFNPLSGQGVRNVDVTEYRYALVESDTVSKEMQLSIIRALELPCAAIVDSGGKSIHAIVRVDARDHSEYRDRVERLYSVCRKNGLEPDPQNKNPSRLSRMPGAVRGDAVQRLVSGPCGKPTWAEWWEWVQETSDDLPDPESLADAWDDMPDLAPPLIDGVLRQGHKMLLAGPSKAGKSLALIELCAAIAEGASWMGWRCAQGRVLYVNLELDSASCLHRFRDVYGAMGLSPDHLGNIDVWNLRGRSVPMDRLAPSLIRRALKTRPIAVIIDPIYKVITGDENSASEMALFCNQFDKVAQQVGCAVIYCHHHSKGYQGAKRSMDRASGSGVFARDPDALLDMTELEVTDDCRREHDMRSSWAACQDVLDRCAPWWRDSVPPDTQGVAARFMDWAKENMPFLIEKLDAAYRAAGEAARTATAWRIEGTLREFPGFTPRNLWFEYPAHRLDDTGALADLRPDGEPPTPAERRRRGRGRASKRVEEERRERVRIMRDALAACREDGIKPTRDAVREMIERIEGMTVSKETMQNWTQARAKWSPIRCRQDGSNELYDTEDEVIDWDGEASVG